MSFSGGWGSGTGLITPTLSWTLLALLAVTVAIGIGIGKFIAGGNARDEPARIVSQCAINGHYFQVHTTEWRCATCGALVPVDDEPHEQAEHTAAAAPYASIFLSERTGHEGG